MYRNLGSWDQSVSGKTISSGRECTKRSLGLGTSCLNNRKSINSQISKSPSTNNSRPCEVLFETAKCFFPPSANSTLELEPLSFRIIATDSKFNQPRLQRQLPFIPRNFPRYHRRAAFVLLPTMVNLRRKGGEGKAKRRFSNNHLRNICFIPLDSRT